MSRLTRLKTLSQVVIFVIALQTLSAQPVAPKRLYVAPFTTKFGPEKLREGVISELRKLNTVSVVDNQADAGLILNGGGEVWVKGYRSLNPRSGRSPSNGLPVYGGYLAVELSNQKGQTFWSDLVTPGSETGDVTKDLSKRIAKQIAGALSLGDAAFPAPTLSPPKTILKGAGATFPAPVYDKWFTNYRAQNPNLEIAYDSIGSEAGVRKLLAGEIDFAASDNPEAVHTLAPGQESKYLLFPTVAGAVVPIVNLPGFAGEIAFTPEALAGIYLGTIRKWNDPVLRQANRGLRFPDLDILVVHRSDGSGTSYAFTDFLSQTVSLWKAQVSFGLNPKWPTGLPAAGNDGVAKEVKERGGSIGYVEYIYALKNHLSFGKVRNRNGEYVAASLEGIAIAANQSAKITDDLKISVVNAPGDGAYPIASFTWLVVPAHIADDDKRAALTGFLKWMLGPGQRQAAALGFLALPQDLVARESAAIARVH